MAIFNPLEGVEFEEYSHVHEDILRYQGFRAPFGTPSNADLPHDNSISTMSTMCAVFPLSTAG
jgi:hypothetical protein